MGMVGMKSWPQKLLLLEGKISVLEVSVYALILIGFAGSGLRRIGGRKISLRICSGMLFSLLRSTILLTVDIICRLMLEYSRLMSLDRGAASYKEWDTGWTRD